MSDKLEISSPYRFPLLGHTPYLLGEFPSGKIFKIGESRGGVWRIHLPNSSFIAVTTFRVMDELCDEKRYEKAIHGGQIELRKVVRDGLFTATTGDEAWSKAHRIVLPGFGSKSMGTYLPVMNQISRTMVESWAANANRPIDVSHYMTMASLEIIGVCGFDYHFTDFENYKETAFVSKLKSVFFDANLSTVFPEALMNLLFASNMRRKSNIKVMNGVVDDVIEKRLSNPEDYKGKKDFLSLMLEGVDNKDGSKLSRENIRYQLITFLAAGYETTASLLGFCIYYLVKNPDVLERARQSVDEVFAESEDGELTFKDLSRLSYLKMIINETLRLWPTASGYFLRPKEPTVFDEKYPVKEDDVFFISLAGLHRDREIWGDDPEAFNPENFTPENIKQRPRNAFKPFGNGMRACIGRHFAITEAQVILAHILRRFNLIDFKNYKLIVDESVTLKAKNFHIKVSER